MDSVGARILNFIERKGISIAELADKIEIDATELKTDLEKNALEIKTLEKISKELRIPLYSFFTNTAIEEIRSRNNFEIPYYIERLDPNEKWEFNNLINGLIEEIESLKRLLDEKDREIEILKRMGN